MPSYRSLLAESRWRRFAVAALAARLPITMAAFGMILAGRSLGSFALGARMAAAYTASAAAAALWQGRRLDRRDLRDGLVRQGVIVAATSACLAVCVDRSGPAALATALAVVLGVVMAAVAGGYRALLPLTLVGLDVEMASALDAVCVEVCFVLGPAVAGAVAWFAGATGIFVALAACALLGSAATRRLPPTRGARPSVRTGVPRLRRNPAMVAVVIGAVGTGMALGVLDGAYPALAVVLGTRPSIGGVFVAVMALGSGAVGFALGPRLARHTELGWPSVALLATFGALVLPAAAAPDLGMAMVLILVAGAPFALMATSASLIVQRSVGAGRAAEAFSLLNAGLLAGLAAGNSAVSVLIGTAGVRGTLLAAGVGPLAAACVLAVALRWSAPPKGRRAQLSRSWRST